MSTAVTADVAITSIACFSTGETAAAAASMVGSKVRMKSVGECCCGASNSRSAFAMLRRWVMTSGASLLPQIVCIMLLHRTVYSRMR
eukprot:4497207-Pleurochrysis_carterae.AAC.1